MLCCTETPRSYCLTLHARPRILARPRAFHPVSYARPWTSSVHLNSNLSTEAFTFRSRITSSLVCPDIIFEKLVCWSRSIVRNRKFCIANMASSRGELTAIFLTRLTGSRNRQVLSVLKDVADQLQFLKTVADAEIDEKFAQVVRL
jgi:hypothetical protein